MKKFTKKQTIELLKDVRINFSLLIDAVIYFDSKDKDEIGFEIINHIDSLKTIDEIDLLINDLINRNFDIPTKLLYNSIWYGLNNNDELRLIIAMKIENSNKKIELLNYLFTLDKVSEQDAYVNIHKLLKMIKNNNE